MLSPSTATTGSRRRAAAAPTPRPDEPARRDTAEAHDGALDQRQQPTLAPVGAVPGEAAAGRREVAPQRLGGQHREREQERGRLTADEEEPPAGNGRGPLGRASSCTGRRAENDDDRAIRAARAASASSTSRSISQRRGFPAVSGRTQP